MSNLLNGVLVGALVISVSAAAPARAETATTVGGILLLSAIVSAASKSARNLPETSVNTQYALTGVGTPQISVRQEELWSEFRANSK